MSFKSVILLLGVMLIEQSSLAAPASDSSSNEVAIDPWKAVNERFRLLGITIGEMRHVYIYITVNGTPIFKQVLEDPHITSVKTEAMKEEIEVIQKFFDKINVDQTNPEKSINIFYRMHEIEDIRRKFNTNENENLSEVEEIIAKSLKEHGVKEFGSEVERLYTKFVENFTKGAEQYISGLTEKEKKNEEKRIRWIDNFKTEKDFKKHYDLIDHFFDDLHDSSDESK